MTLKTTDNFQYYTWKVIKNGSLICNPFTSSEILIAPDGLMDSFDLELNDLDSLYVLMLLMMGFALAWRFF